MLARTNRRTTFRGFSTVGADNARSWRLFDAALVRRDLLNHFHTRPGERVMRPSWGCRIWEWLMEPLTESLRLMVVEEALRVCREDTRVEVVDVDVAELESGLRIDIALLHLPDRAAETFSVDFEARQDRPTEVM